MWEIRHSAHEITIGTRVVSEDDLRGMFGLPLPHDHCLLNSASMRWIHSIMADTVFEQVIGRSGYFLRADDFLNIPCPGTGRDGDPNISIEIDVAMRDAVQEFLDNSI